MSETPTETPVEPTTTPEVPAEPAAEPDKGAEKDWQAEADKWKALARKHEGASKANADKAKQFDEITEAQKSELDKALEKAAAAEKRAADLEEAKTRVEVAADKGVPAALLSGKTQEELEASADALLTFRGEKPKPDFGGGDKGTDVGTKKAQLSRDDVKRMTPEEIVQAQADGRFADLLKGS